MDQMGLLRVELLPLRYNIEYRVENLGNLKSSRNFVILHALVRRVLR